MDTAVEAVTRPRGPGILLGVGLGGFVDGIVLHQILQWHHMLTGHDDYPATTVAGLETNTLWDGLFHAATWVAVAVGIWILWRRTTDWRWAISGRAFVGWMLVGWGLFNLVEGSSTTTSSASTMSARRGTRPPGTSASSRSARSSSSAAGSSLAPTRGTTRSASGRRLRPPSSPIASYRQPWPIRYRVVPRT